MAEDKIVDLVLLKVTLDKNGWQYLNKIIKAKETDKLYKLIDSTTWEQQLKKDKVGKIEKDYIDYAYTVTRRAFVFPDDIFSTKTKMIEQVLEEAKEMRENILALPVKDVTI